MCRCVPPSKNEASNSNFNAIWDLPLILWFEQKNKPALLLCFIACLTKLHYNIAFFRVCIQRCPVLYGKEGLSLDVTLSNMCLSVQSVQSKLKVTFANKHTWKTFFFYPVFWMVYVNQALWTNIYSCVRTLALCQITDNYQMAQGG